MAVVHVTCVAERDARPREEDLVPSRFLRDSARCDPRRVHKLTDDPAAADLIIFAEAGDDHAASGQLQQRVREHPLARQSPGKCFVHSSLDRPVPLMPGIYPSITRKWHDPAWTAGGCHLVPPNPALAEFAPVRSERRAHVASFVGPVLGRPVRYRLLELARSEGFSIEDTSQAYADARLQRDEAAIRALRKRSIATAADSLFALCPRGMGASTVRLFEAMELGVAPVVLSDDWVEPPGPSWSTFCLRVPERDVARLPDVLRVLGHHAPKMGQLARAAWERYFAPRAVFHATVQSCLSIAQARRQPESLERARARVQMLQPWFSGRAAKAQPVAKS